MPFEKRKLYTNTASIFKRHIHSRSTKRSTKFTSLVLRKRGHGQKPFQIYRKPQNNNLLP